MIIPNIWENKKWQPNHQPVIILLMLLFLCHDILPFFAQPWRHLRLGTDLAVSGCSSWRRCSVCSMAGARKRRFCGGLGHSGGHGSRMKCMTYLWVQIIYGLFYTFSWAIDFSWDCSDYLWTILHIFMSHRCFMGLFRLFMDYSTHFHEP